MHLANIRVKNKNALGECGRGLYNESNQKPRTGRGQKGRDMKTTGTQEATLEGMESGSMLMCRIRADQVPPSAMRQGMALTLVDRFDTPIAVMQMEYLGVAGDQAMFGAKAMHAIGAKLPTEMIPVRVMADRLWELQRFLQHMSGRPAAPLPGNYRPRTGPVSASPTPMTDG